MKKEINESEFIKEFDECNRSNNFSVEGRRALFNYFDEDENFELDVIAICCGFSEYENVEEYLNDYYQKGEYEKRFNEFKEEYEGIYDNNEEFKEEFNKEQMEELQDKTLVIMIDEESFIIRCY